MIELVLSVGVLAAVVAMMSVGVLMGRSPIKGSCGGMSALGMKGSCDVCGGEMSRCDSNEAMQDKIVNDKNLAYEAAKPKADQ